MNLHDQTSIVVADMEWSDAARSQGEPVSVAFVVLMKTEDGWTTQNQRYGAKSIDPIDTTSWTRERVLPRMHEYQPEAFELVLQELQAKQQTIVYNDDALAAIFPNHRTIHIQACLLLEHERTRYWGVFKTWCERHDGYHALEDCIGMAQAMLAVLNEEWHRTKHGTIAL